MTTEFVLFVILATVIVTACVGVVVARTIVRGIISLLLALIGIAGQYFLLGAEFLGAAQLIVYVGGTMVLLIFGGMLTSGGPFQPMPTRTGQWVIACTVAAVIFSVLAIASFRLAAIRPPIDPVSASVGEIGVAFLTSHLLPFEIVSVHLLVVLVGAAYLARATKPRTEDAPTRPTLPNNQRDPSGSDRSGGNSSGSDRIPREPSREREARLS